MLNLPLPDHTPLRNPPLPLVVAQARFAALSSEITLDGALRFQAGLRKADYDFDQVKAATGGDIVIGPGSPPTATNSVHGFQFSPADEAWIVTLMPNSVAVETPSFASFTGQFKPLLEVVVRLATEIAEPLTLTRSGLRFVNVLRKPNHDGDWDRWVRPSLLAPINDELLNPGLVSHTQQLVLEIADGVRSNVRTGGAELDGEEALLLDIDTFSETNSLWSPDVVVAQFSDLNGHGVSLFQALVSAEMLAHLGAGGFAGQSNNDRLEGGGDD